MKVQVPMLIGLGTIVFLLSIYLGMLMMKLRKQNLDKREYFKRLETDLSDKDKFYKDSIITICMATVQGQCDLSEACIRIKKLLEFYPEISSESQFEVIQLMYSEIQGFDTHAARTKLTKRERFGQDKE